MDSADWDDRYRSTDRLWSAGPNVFVESRLGDLAPGRGLDVASGEGRNAIWLAEQGWDMTAVDFSGVAVERGRSRSDSVDFIHADVLEWEPDEPFDLVLIAYLQFEAERLQKVVERAVSWVAPGGDLFMIGHDRTNLEDGIGGPPTPEVLWEIDSILDWIGDLKIVEAGVVDRQVEVDGDVALARDALVRARAGPG